MQRRLLFAGLEGACWADLHRLIEAGRLPTVARLVETGASGRFDPQDLSGPMLWATIATGTPPQKHGVTGLWEVRLDGGGIQPVGARSWRVPPVWQTLAEAGVPTAIVGLPGIAPAALWPRVAHACIVDETFAEPAGALVEDWPLRPDCIVPTRLRAELRSQRLHPEELDEQARGGLPAGAVALAASNNAAACHIAEHEDWQFLAVYHRLLLHDGGDTAYGFLDAMLGRLLSLAGPQTDVMVVAPSGVLIAAGPSFPADTILHGTVPADIAATLLARFGLRARCAFGRPFLDRTEGKLREVEGKLPASVPASPGPAPSAAAQALIDRVHHEADVHVGWLALASGDYEVAAERLQAALDRRPGDANALFLLGQCRFFLGQTGSCRALGEQVAQLAPDRAWGALLIGGALALEGRADDAEPHLQRAADLAGEEVMTRIRLGAILLHAGQPGAALIHYRAARASDPSSHAAQAGIGLSLLASGDQDGAERHLRAALGLQFHAPAVHLQLGHLYAGQRRWVDAARAVRLALAQDPDLSGAAKLLRAVENAAATRAARAATEAA